MYLDIEFARPLDTGTRRRLLLALAGLAKCQRLRIDRDGRGARILGEALSRERVRAALAEYQVVCAAVTSSLTSEDDARADER